MRKITLANLETTTLKAFRNIFAHHKNAEAKISDLVSCIPVELRYGSVNGTGCFNRATASVLKLMMIIQVYPRFSTLRRRLMKLTGQTID